MKALLPAAAVLGLALAALLLAGLPAPAPPEVQSITTAAFLKSDAADPGGQAGQPWERRDLPDLWRRHRPNDAGFGWYTAGFDIAHQPDTPWAVLVDHANSAMALRVNGLEVGREAPFDAVHVAARASPPLLFVVPAALLHAGRNTLAIHLRVERDINGGLSAVEIGPQEWIMPRHQAQRFWRIDLPRALNMAGLVAALFVALLWLRRPAEAIYPWFCALAVTWALRSMYFTGDDMWLMPLRRLVGLGGNDLFLATTLSLGFALLVIVVNRFARRQAPMVERLSLCLCLILPLAVVPLGNQVLAPLLPAWHGLAVLLAAAAVATAGRLAWAERHWSYAIILAGIVFMLATGVHDWLVVAGLVDFTPMPWQVYGPPVMLATVVAALGGRYFAAFDDAARLNRDLERRVADKTAEISGHYARIAELERATAIAGERDRLMRDMHDGVGSQLITMLHAIEKGRLAPVQTAALLRECIDDLRLVIDSLSSEAQGLSDALADLRFRLESRLSAAGIGSTWDIDETPPGLAPGAVLQILRILQEALTNTLKHSQAHTVAVSWRVDRAGGTGTLCVADDGIGIGHAQAPGGRGLANMRQRALRAGAALDLHSDTRGTAVTVTVDLGAVRT